MRLGESWFKDALEVRLRKMGWKLQQSWLVDVLKVNS